MQVNTSSLGMARVSGGLLLVLLLCCGLLDAQSPEPYCSNIRDFGRCIGTTTNFCPKNVECACKDQKPFCKCPNYRVSWTDYWYMGPKCEQLWSTLDLILVIVFPAVALASMTGVTVQWIYYCKNKPQKRKHASARKEARNEMRIPKINPAYIPEDYTKEAFAPSRLPMQRLGPEMIGAEHYQVAWTRPPQNHSSSPLQQTVFPQVMRKPDPTYNQYSQNYQHEYSTPPGQDSEERTLERPIPPVSRIPRPKFDVPALPKEDYELNAYPSNEPAQLSTRPFVFGRPKVKNQYDY
ncbi:uncharacterized protein [Ambystoma mexicanum]|uniref:uncharacterized protein n=1 Tax=Ambystoma mexicanum TaxID=8296 RepID=UPI0037E999D6